jgi:hypothetical protein
MKEMPNFEHRMPNGAATPQLFVIRASSFVRISAFGFRHAERSDMP